MTDLHEELRKAREAVQLVKEAAEAEKQATYMLGVEETQARLTEELSAVVGSTVASSEVKPLMLLRFLRVLT